MLIQNIRAGDVVAHEPRPGVLVTFEVTNWDRAARTVSGDVLFSHDTRHERGDFYTAKATAVEPAGSYDWGDHGRAATDPSFDFG